MTIKLVPKKIDPDPHTIDCLKDLLKQAESGEINSLIYVVQHSDELCSYGSVGYLDIQPNRMCGALENAKLVYQLNHCIEHVPGE